MAARLRIVTTIFLGWVVFFLAARAGFLLYQAPMRSLSASAIAAAFGAGFRLDLSGAAYLSTVPLLAMALGTVGPLAGVARRIVWFWLVVAIGVATLLVVTDLELSSAWGRRIDAAVLPYLATPAEAWASAGASPRFGLLLLAAVAIAAFVVLARRLLKPLDLLTGWSLGALPPLVGLLGLFFVIARGGFATWPLTVSSAYRSDDPRVNLLAENAIWGFFDSIYRRHYDRSNRYARLPVAAADSAIAATRHPAGPPAAAPFRTERPNLILIVWESASARAFGSLGGVAGSTPRFDSLARTGTLFTRFYAAGDRTDKGVAALLSGFPAVPRGSIMMTPSKTRALPSLQAELEKEGYRTAFYYGGQLEFASLQAYLANTGFDRRVGKSGFPRASWNSQWGAHDGVVADRLLADLETEREPFFATWLTLSSHEPFEVPGEPGQPDDDWQTRYLRSIRYTDRVIGDFVRRASARPWWARTAVIIVADHGRRLLPLDEAAVRHDPETDFRIPMLWLGGALATGPAVVDQVGSQLDLAPTVLDAVSPCREPTGRAGVDALDHPGRETQARIRLRFDSGCGPDRLDALFRFGRSLLRPATRPVAYFGFDEGFGLVTATTALVDDQRAGREILIRGPVGAFERTVGRAFLQVSYQEYLDR